MSIQVMFDGKPLANQQVYVSHAGIEAPEGKTIPEIAVHSLRTDADGKASFEITEKQKWYIQLIHMQKVDDDDADWESNWSTITFEIR